MSGAAALGQPPVSFAVRDDRVEIDVQGRPFASYVFRDAKILRPYLAHVRAPSGVQVTRHHPPQAGEPADHDLMHPGVWLAFGDLSSADFWRNKSAVKHIEFIQQPSADPQSGHFEVKNAYVADGRTLCEERCRIAIRPIDHATLVVLHSQFSGPQEFYFGDQEEMGLGVRVATPMAVRQGGRLTNGEGRSGEKQVWGRQADWCDYSGTVGGHAVGVMIVPDPNNFRRSWFHARDYGFVAANPFGRNAFTKGEKSKVVVPPGETLSLGFALVVHEGDAGLDKLYDAALAEMKTP
jgi:hypothetical protein